MKLGRSRDGRNTVPACLVVLRPYEEASSLLKEASSACLDGDGPEDEDAGDEQTFYLARVATD